MNRFLTLTCMLLCVNVMSADEKHVEFLNALRQQGHADLAVQYLESLEKQAGLAADVRAILDFELGETLLQQASNERDLIRRESQLNTSRDRFEAFLKKNGNHQRSGDAATSLARILVERGKVAVMQSRMPSRKAQAPQLVRKASEYFDQATERFSEAEAKYDIEYKSFPSFIDPTGAGNKIKIERRRFALLNLMDTQLQLGIVDYEHGQVFEIKTPQRTKKLTEAIARFEKVYQNYRDWIAGLYSRMWMGKCYEEMGDVRKAVGFYTELEKHEDPKINPLKRQVQYFHMICMNKRGDHILARERGEAWLIANKSEGRSRIGLGVRMTLADALISLAKDEPENSGAQQALIRQAVSEWNQVSRQESEFKETALALKSKWGSTAVVGNPETFEDALAQAERARESQKWDEASVNYDMALALATDEQEIAQLNQARYLYGFTLYQTKHYLKAGLLCEHIAFRHSDSGLAPNAAYVALAAYVKAYESETGTKLKEIGEAKLGQLAEFLERRWPESEEANFSRMVRGGIALTKKDYPTAAQVYAGVTSTSADYGVAQSRAGESYWNSYLEGVIASDAAARSKELQSYLKSARTALVNSRKGRAPDGATTEPAVRSDLILAQVNLEDGQPKEAIALLEPISTTVQESPEFAHLRMPVLTSRMQAHIRLRDFDKAESLMDEIEKSGQDTAQITALFQSMASQQKKNLDRLEALGDKDVADAARESFKSFLDRLSKREAGQNLDSLSWIAASQIGLGAYDQAEKTYRSMISTYGGGSSAKSRPIRSARLHLVVSLRMQEKWKEADSESLALLKANPKALDVIMERGRVLTWAAKHPEAVKHWKQFGAFMGYVRPKPVERYHCWLYLSLTRYATTDAKEKAMAARELTYVKTTMSEADRSLPLNASFDDVMSFARSVGYDKRPATLGEMVEALIAAMK